MPTDVNLPAVIVKDHVPDNIHDACSITQDDSGGGFMLARHLIEHRARNLLFASPARNWPASKGRRAGIEAALKEHALLSRVECNEKISKTQRLPSSERSIMRRSRTPSWS